MLDHTRLTFLPNGATIVTSEIPTAESVALGIFVNVGGRHEPRKLAGISHFLEHMLFKGTPTRSALEISRAIEGRGGGINAYTQEDGTCYHARLPYEHLEKAFDVLNDMYRNATIAEDDFKRERDVIIEEIKMYKDLPQAVVMERMQEAMFMGHALGVPLAGDEKSLRGMTRQTLLDYKARAYVPGATIYAFAGRLSHDRCVALVERANSGVRRAKVLPFKPVDNRVRQQRLTVTHKEIEQVHAIAGFRVFGRHDDRRSALRVLNVLLGENMSSRLFQSVRERNGMCYSINSHYQFFAETGIFAISAGLDAQRALAALRLTAREVRRVVEKPIGAAELKRVKEYLLGTVRLSLESVEGQMAYVASSAQNYGRVVPPSEMLAKLKAVTADDVRSVACDIFEPSRMTLSLVTPRDLSVSEDQWLQSFDFG